MKVILLRIEAQINAEQYANAMILLGELATAIGEAQRQQLHRQAEDAREHAEALA